MLGAVEVVGSWLEVWLRLIFYIFEAGKENKGNLKTPCHLLFTR